VDVLALQVVLLASAWDGQVMRQCHLAYFDHGCDLRFWEVAEPDRGRGAVALAVVAGSLEVVGVVAGALDDAGIGALAALVQVLRAGDVGGDLVQDALALVRGEKPGRRPGGGRRGWSS